MITKVEEIKDYCYFDKNFFKYNTLSKEVIDYILDLWIKSQKYDEIEETPCWGVSIEVDELLFYQKLTDEQIKKVLMLPWNKTNIKYQDLSEEMIDYILDNYGRCKVDIIPWLFSLKLTEKQIDKILDIYKYDPNEETYRNELPDLMDFYEYQKLNDRQIKKAIKNKIKLFTLFSYYPEYESAEVGDLTIEFKI